MHLTSLVLSLMLSMSVSVPDNGVLEIPASDMAAGKSDGKVDVEALRAFGRADVYAERAQTYWGRIWKFLADEYNLGRREVSREDWDEKVMPDVKKAVMNMDMAISEIESVLPEKCESEFWKDIKNKVLWHWQVNTDVLRKQQFFDSEYLLNIGYYPSYIDMYFAIFNGKFEAIEHARKRLEELAHIE